MHQSIPESEFTDRVGPSHTEIQGNLNDIATLNRWFGGTSVVLHHLSHLTHAVPSGQSMRILDVASGLADIPVAAVHWARRRGISVGITAIDADPVVAEQARMHTAQYPEIVVCTQDALDLPYEDGSFDLVICSQFLHRLDDSQVVHLLRDANRLSLSGIIVSDLQRRPIGKLIGSVGSAILSNRLSSHDIRVSFSNAFTPDELARLAESAGLPNPSLHLHGPCRIALVIDKRNCARSRSAEQCANPALALV